MSFRITGNKGFHITFDNGYTVSVQFGPGNYCEHHDAMIGVDNFRCGSKGSSQAEIAVWGPDHELLQLEGWSNTVCGCQSADAVLPVMNWAAKQERGSCPRPPNALVCQ